MLVDKEVIMDDVSNFTFDGERKYIVDDRTGQRDRVIDCMGNADWFLKTQDRVRTMYADPEICVLAIILSFDETCLTGGTGGSSRTTTPLYISIGNLNIQDGKLPAKSVQCLGFFPEILVSVLYLYITF